MLSSRQIVFSCLDCHSDSPAFPSIEELEIHISSDHLNHFPYECERCRFAKFPTEYALITHCKADHGMQEFYVRYRLTPEGERKTAELKSKLRNCLLQRRDLPHEASILLSDSIWKTEPDTGRSSTGSSLSPAVDTNCGHSVKRILGSDYKDDQKQGKIAVVQKLTNFKLLDIHLVSSQLPSVSSCSNATTTPCSSTTTCPVMQSSDLSPIDFHANLQNSDVNLQNVNGLDLTALIESNEEITKKKQRNSTYQPKQIVICQVCGLKVSNQRSSLIYHANTKHIKLNLFECAECKKTWQTIAKSDVLKHVKAIHNGDEQMIVDNRKKLQQQLRSFTAKCFPPEVVKRLKRGGGYCYYRFFIT
ncbi:hypothetical protein WR25_17325 [Diploscapter pachys]|uniref:C2H2-type domain-containing protein n=1 Tax=Diploscapter pachys TaxID=2018661 RepID=A0A2A2JNI8_9BILA|nr:hypothetical protein WR25_17325 [Diploscapter pachys]